MLGEADRFSENRPDGLDVTDGSSIPPELLALRAFLYEPSVMNGAEFLRRLRKTGKRRGVAVRFVATRGKGSHGTVFFGV